MQDLTKIYPEHVACISEQIGPNFAKTMSFFTSSGDMAMAISQPRSTINHIIKGRIPERSVTRNRVEKACEVWLRKNTFPVFPTPEINISAPPTEAQATLLVKVPAGSMDKVMTVLDMLDCQVADL